MVTDSYGLYYAAPTATNILESLVLLRYYGEKTLSNKRLVQVAQNIEDKEWLALKEAQWLAEPDPWETKVKAPTQPKQIGFDYDYD